ncbi:hypothetical protein HMPREF6485_0205 [Segatella buccae ATCC 33574]|uniref:Uncharacterized protein n=1 Tax=Segatella buccae ATCC 33574 TaxID=873513 RepID=E6K3Q2_9BACT|nr:hypothetical protein HMPREF6485_0205 [Segatella buccae ATCC 33574]
MILHSFLFSREIKKVSEAALLKPFLFFYSSQVRCIPADVWSPAIPANACRRVSRHRVISPSAVGPSMFSREISG